MQIGSRQCVWNEGNRGTVIEVEMTPVTGLYIHLIYNATQGHNVRIAWGDGEVENRSYASGNLQSVHVYRSYGKYRIVIKGVSSVGFRSLDGQPHYGFDAAIISFVDYSGQIVSSRSGAFKRARNLKRFIAPNCNWLGQCDFAYCFNLEEVEVGNVSVAHDGVFLNCAKLEKFTTKSSGVCWNYIWLGCSSLRELNLGNVDQLGVDVFAGTAKLSDIYIANRTVDQIIGIAESGNLEVLGSPGFPWGANANCRFHGVDGIVLGNGQIIQQ